MFAKKIAYKADQHDVLKVVLCYANGEGLLPKKAMEKACIHVLQLPASHTVFIASGHTIVYSCKVVGGRIYPICLYTNITTKYNSLDLMQKTFLVVKQITFY